MKKSSDVGIGVGVAGLSGGQAVLLVMEYPLSSWLLIVICYTAGALDSETPIDIKWPKDIHQITAKSFG